MVASKLTHQSHKLLGECLIPTLCGLLVAMKSQKGMEVSESHKKTHSLHSCVVLMLIQINILKILLLIS
jgi:hypothetical protein